MIYNLNQSVDFWQKLDIKQRSASLAATKFVHLAEKHDSKADAGHKKKAIEAIASVDKADSIATEWDSFLTSLWKNKANTPCELLFATPEASLLMNLSGGVMENAGLSLDPLSGVPRIPGSAVKGCARRMALWCLSQEEDEEKKADILTNIALIFGWGDQEWTLGRTSKKEVISDFWLAMAPYDDALNDAEADKQRTALWERVSRIAQEKIKSYANCPFKNSFAGLINFLPSYPHSKGEIECDIITPHHSKYYDKKLPTASDTEEPIPVNLPRVSFPKTNYFSFALTTAKLKDKELLTQASAWLRESLGLFGIGAKTSAGYGWFSFDGHDTKLAAFEEKIQVELEQKQKAAEQTARQAKMSPLDLEIEKLSKMDEAEFANTLKLSADSTLITQQALADLFQNNRAKKEKYKTWRKKKPDLAKIVEMLIKNHKKP